MPATVVFASGDILCSSSNLVGAEVNVMDPLAIAAACSEYADITERPQAR
jgi:hypothetical protein